MYQNTPTINKKHGEDITASYVSQLLVLLYKKFNALIPDNYKFLTTGQLVGGAGIENLKFPNYSGMISGNVTANATNPVTLTALPKLTRLYDAPIFKSNKAVKTTMEKLRG